MLFRYFFSLRSKMVYLSLGSISASVGMSAFQRSSDRAVMPCLASAWSSVATTLSTARSRLRWRAFWNRDSRQGDFLQPASQRARTRRERRGRPITIEDPH